jgi:GNAT superfamily N-acetyltransferase
VALWATRDGEAVASTVITVRDGADVAVYCMATPAAHQRRGHGRRLLGTALARQAAEGAARAYLVATPPGEPLYAAMGFRTVELLRMWVEGDSAQFS